MYYLQFFVHPLLKSLSTAVADCNMADETATQPQLSVSHLLNYMLYKKTCRIFVFICVRWADVYSSAGIEVARPGEQK